MSDLIPLVPGFCPPTQCPCRPVGGLEPLELMELMCMFGSLDERCQ
jgi:hypothetical protein